LAVKKSELTAENDSLSLDEVVSRNLAVKNSELTAENDSLTDITINSEYTENIEQNLSKWVAHGIGTN